MPFQDPKCPGCGRKTTFFFDSVLPPGGAGANPYWKYFQRYGQWFADRELMCGYCRREWWLSRWKW